jgi:hypothetical protein
MTMGSGTASADTIGDHSIGGGNQVNVPIKLPIDISGNAVGVLGDATASSEGGASVQNGGGGGGGGAGGNRTSGQGSILGGNQIVAPITAPINACGNAVSVFGRAEAGCEGGATVKDHGGGGGAGGNRTNGDHSILGGNQIVAPITAPINACGNAVAIFGKATAGCKGGASVRGGGGGGGAGGNRTSGRGSILGGNQIIAPITAPINVCGNAVAVLGDAFAGCKGGASVMNPRGPRPDGSYEHDGHDGHDGPGKSDYSEHGSRPGWHGSGPGRKSSGPGWHDSGPRGNGPGYDSGPKGNGPGYDSGPRGNGPGWHDSGPGWNGPGSGAGGNETSGQGSLLGGNQVVAPITAPINVCGNAIGNGQAGCLGGSFVENGHGGGGAGGNRTSGRGSLLGGNQIIAPITAPINVCGNAVALLGNAFAGCQGGASVSGGGGGGAGGNRTNGDHSILGGNQIIAPITAPINACGNAVAVLGDAAAGCLGGSHVGGSSGRPGGNGGGHGGDYDRWDERVGKDKYSGLLPALPMAPASGAKGSGKIAHQAAGSASALPSLPLVGEVQDMANLPELPIMGGAQDMANLPELSTTGEAQDVAGLPAAPADAEAPESKDASPLAPATDLGSSTPVGGALPLGDVGLMSAAQPIGMTGMNSGSLFALLFGAMAAASAMLFATTRRIRFGKK